MTSPDATMELARRTTTGNKRSARILLPFGWLATLFHCVVNFIASGIRVSSGERAEEGEEREGEKAQHVSPSCFPFSESFRYCAITIEINYIPGGVISA